MKNIWKSLFVAALFVSCSEQMTEETVAPEVNNGKAIKFEVVNEGSRVGFFEGNSGHGVSFEVGDVVAIRHYTGESSKGNYDWTREYTEEQEAEKTAWLNEHQQRGNYKLQEDGSLTQIKTGNWQDITFVAGLANTICAYFPATSNRYAHMVKSVSLSGEQVQAKANDHSHIGDYMIMMADPQKFAAGEQPEKVYIQLQNVLSIVEVTLKSEETKVLTSLTMKTTSGNPLAMSVGVLNTDVAITPKDAACPIRPVKLDDKTDAEVGPSGLNEITLSLTEAAEVTAEGAKFYFVVLPGAHEKGDITLTANFAGGTYAEKQMGAIEFKMNKVYRPEVAFTAADVKLAEEIELHFDFSTIPVDADGTKWGTGKAISSTKKASTTTCKRNTYGKGVDTEKTFKMADGSSYLFTFTSTKDSSVTGWDEWFGTVYRDYSNDGTVIQCLTVLPGNKGQSTQTIGLPVREGYKLVRVEGYCDPQGQDKSGTYVAITSDAGGVKVNPDTMFQGTQGADGNKPYEEVVADDSTVVSEFEGMTTKKVIEIVKNQTTPWTFTIPTAQKNTRYYLSVSGPYFAIEHLYLTYERVDE